MARAGASERRATRDRHPGVATRAEWPRKAVSGVAIPRDVDDATIALGEQQVKLTNLRKPFWPELGLTKGDLLRYYAEVAPALLPHLADRITCVIPWWRSRSQCRHLRNHPQALAPSPNRLVASLFT